MIDIAKFRDSRDSKHLCAFWDVRTARIDLRSNSVIEAWRLTLLIGATILLPIRGAVDDARVTVRRIGIRHESFHSGMVAFDELDGTRHKPRFRVKRLRIHDVEAGKLPHERDAVPLHGFAWRKSEHDNSDKKRPAPHAESANNDSGPAVQVVSKHQRVGLCAARRADRVDREIGLGIAFHAHHRNRSLKRVNYIVPFHIIPSYPVRRW